MSDITTYVSVLEITTTSHACLISKELKHRETLFQISVTFFIRFVPCTLQVPTMKIFSIKLFPTLTNITDLRYTVLHKSVTHSRFNWPV